MLDKRCFGLRDVMVLGVVGVVMLSMVLAGCDEFFPKRSGGRRRWSTQVRGIQQALILYAQSNNNYYPGYNVDGGDNFAALEQAPNEYYSNAVTDDDIGKIYAILLNGEYFTPEYMISPWDNEATQAVLQPEGTLVTSANYSYAMLDMNDADSNRRLEWKDTNNSMAPVVADPSSDIRPLSTVSYFTEKSAADGDSDVDYQGNIAWNDNHVTFETGGLFAPGKFMMGSDVSVGWVNPFRNAGKDGAKLIW